MFRPLLHIALDIIFPPLCTHCGEYLTETRSSLCEACYKKIARNSALVCPICSTRLANNKRACKHSKKALARSPYLLGTATWYADPIARNCIQACKYQRVHALTAPLAQLLIEYADGLEPRPRIFNADPIVVPIPLHNAKERKRGFNQSALIAHTFAQAMGFPCEELLVKRINNDAQAQIKTHAERIARMQGAFLVPQPECVQNKNIIVIDDVSTSGATLAEATQALRSAGARQILALVIARA